MHNIIAFIVPPQNVERCSRCTVCCFSYLYTALNESCSTLCDHRYPGLRFRIIFNLYSILFLFKKKPESYNYGLSLKRIYRSMQFLNHTRTRPNPGDSMVLQIVFCCNIRYIWMLFSLVFFFFIGASQHLTRGIFIEE